MDARHDGADWDVEDLRRVRVGELADVDEDDDAAKVVRNFGEGFDDRGLRELLDHAFLVGVRIAEGRLELVVEEVVPFFKRLGVGLALDAATPVDVEVREDPEEPGAQVRAGLVLLPRAKSSAVRVLDKILGLLSRSDEPTCDAVDLIAELERFLFEADTVPCDLREATGVSRGRCALPHPAAPLATSYNAAAALRIPVTLRRTCARGTRHAPCRPGARRASCARRRRRAS